MMRKILRYTSLFFLWLAGLALSAHLLLPHDHHIAAPFPDQEKNCPASNDESGHKSGFPLHCYAFNDLVSERIRPFHIYKIVQFNIPAISTLADTNVILHSSRISLNCFSVPIFDSFALDFSLLRAPPVSA